MPNMKLTVPFMSVTNYPHKQSRQYNQKKALNVGNEGQK